MACHHDAQSERPMENPTNILPGIGYEIAAGIRQIEKQILSYTGSTEGGTTPVPGLAVTRLTSNVGPIPYIFEPSLCIAARGSKHVTLGEESYRYNETTFLLTSIGLPTIVQVEGASDERPYVSLQLFLDLDMTRQVIADMKIHGLESAHTGHGIVAAPLTTDLLEPVMRLVALLSRPQDIPILASGIHREILYRILTSQAGAQLLQIVCLGTQSNRAAKAIAWLRNNFARRLRIEDLAAECGMAVSTLHHHFKVVTHMSPLQFQKQLRLNAARRLMLTGGIDVGVAAQKVGYESVTQFTREYRRLFGVPPRRDIQALQGS